jgi:hypothetical protein
MPELATTAATQASLCIARETGVSLLSVVIAAASPLEQRVSFLDLIRIRVHAKTFRAGDDPTDVF